MRFSSFGELASEFDVAAHHPAELDEGAHDGDVDLNGAVAVEDRGEHGNSLLGGHRAPLIFQIGISNLHSLRV